MAEAGGKQGEQDDQQKRRRGFTATTVYATFGFLTALVSFIFLVNPAWRPDPREAQVADLTIAAFDIGITLRSYAKRVGQPNAPVAKGEEGCFAGNVVYLKERLQGFKHRDATLRFLTMAARTHQRVHVGEMEKAISGGTASKLTGEVTSDQGVSVQWVQWPHSPGTYFIRFELFRGHDLLAIADTEKFSVSKSQTDDLEQSCLRDIDQEGPGFSEASLGGAGGFDVGRWLLYAAVAVTVGLLAALAFHGTTGVLRRRRQ